jgi:hypothetical protein
MHYSMVLPCVGTLLDFMSQRMFEYGDIMSARKICTAVKSLNS